MIRQWVNIEDEAAPHALLRRIEQRVPAHHIDTLWIFPTRRAAGFESSVIVVSSFEPEDPDRRHVHAARFLVSRDRKGRATVQDEFYDFALAPAETLTRVVEGVLRRLGEDTAEAPRAQTIEGDASAWTELLRSLGAPDPAAAPASSE